MHDSDERIGGGVQAPVVLVKVVAVEEVIIAVLSLSKDTCIEKGKTDVRAFAQGSCRRPPALAP